jgi:hypothetical protein
LRDEEAAGNVEVEIVPMALGEYGFRDGINWTSKLVDEAGHKLGLDAVVDIGLGAFGGCD